MERRFEGIWIPANIWLSPSLSLQEKVFLVEIQSLDNEEGCYASNQYFAEFFNLSKARASEVINGLVKKGLIVSVIDEKNGNRRILRMCSQAQYPYSENRDTPIRQTQIPYSENTDTLFGKGEDPIRQTGIPYSEKAEHNNIYNNTSSSTTNSTVNKTADADFSKNSTPTEKPIEKGKEKSCAKKEKTPQEPCLKTCEEIYQRIYPEYMYRYGRDTKFIREVIGQIRHKLTKKLAEKYKDIIPNPEDLIPTQEEVEKVFEWFITAANWYRDHGHTTPKDFAVKFENIYQSIVQTRQEARRKASPMAPDPVGTDIEYLTRNRIVPPQFEKHSIRHNQNPHKPS